MRSRDMMTKLDRLPSKPEPVKVWDLSLLSPAEQDRANELLKLLGGAEDLDAPDLQDELVEFRELVRDLPMLAEDEPEGGPKIEVPYDLDRYWLWSQPASEWRSYSFSNLTKVQTLRFVDLCREYGYCGEGSVKDQIAPLVDWTAADRNELASLLDVADGGHSHARP